MCEVLEHLSKHLLTCLNIEAINYEVWYRLVF